MQVWKLHTTIIAEYGQRNSCTLTVGLQVLVVRRLLSRLPACRSISTWWSSATVPKRWTLPTEPCIHCSFVLFRTFFRTGL